MKHSLSIITFILCSFYLQNVFGQTDPSFDSFKGEVYKMPYIDAKKGYDKKKVDGYTSIGNVEWDELNIPEQDDRDLLPGINKKNLVCMILKSSMTIHQDGCYALSLSSDDGSILWIADELVINNDGEHGMREKTDTLLLKKGIYPIKVWYYQAYPDKCGIVLKANYTEKYNTTKTISKLEKIQEKAAQKSIVLQGKFLFDTNKSNIQKEAFPILDSLCNDIKDVLPKKITIIGHTDNVGKSEYNLSLSNKRAATITQYLMQKVNLPDIQYMTQGMGKKDPISSNETEKGRTKNRRVEIILE